MIKIKITRREFLKLLGIGALVGASVFTSNEQKKRKASKVKNEKKGNMSYREDPKSSNMLSLLGFGMMRLPVVERSRGESLPDVNDTDQEAVNALVDYAIANGVNIFDTAPVYSKGFSEKATGIALSRYPREKYFISTKMSNHRGLATTREGSIQIYENSFKNLQTDYIDYYLLHNVGNHSSYQSRFLDNGMLDFLLKEKASGRIKQLGFSFHGDGSFLEFFVKEYPWDFGLIQLNFLDWDNIMGWTSINGRRQYELLTENNIPVWVMEPLLGGGLARPHFLAREKMMKENPNATPPSWALRFVGSLPNVNVVLSGMTFMDHVIDNINTFSPFVPLNENEQKMIAEVAKIMLEKRTIRCTLCQYCMPCPYGIDIPAIFDHYNRCLNEGNYPENFSSNDFKRARKAFLIGLNRKVLPYRQADRCINCRLCVPSCPQRINIPAEMRRIDAFIEDMKKET